MTRFLPLILASRSERRAELLRGAGIPFEIKVVDVDEATRPGEDSESYVQRVASAKAQAVASAEPERFVIGGDTAVVVDGQILGKPSDPADAARMLQLLSGRAHLVVTGVCFLGPHGSGWDAETFETGSGRPVPLTHVASTNVEFAPLTSQEIEWYVASGEPMDKAGGYAIQGLASRFVPRIEGSYSNVVGLPLALVYRLCKQSGILVS
jgi:septum formation protein